jgi:Holliday junction resolvasome RuvABC endonuclease subunit
MSKADIAKLYREMEKSKSWEKLEKHFVGIDPSLAGNAVVIINDKGEIEHTQLICTDKECYINGEQRVTDIFDQLGYIDEVARLESVYIEGLAYSSNSTTLFERCGLLYLILNKLLNSETNYAVIPPTFLKKWHTTDGHADKDMMMCVAKCKYGIDFQDDNICDAYCLAMLALEDWKNNIKRG